MKHLHRICFFVILAGCTAGLYIAATFATAADSADPLISETVVKYEDELPETVSFNAHVRPLLSNACFACHGPDDNANHSGVRLDTWEAAVNEAGVIEPNDAAASRLYQRLVDADDPMPPAESIHQLTDYEKALIKKWISQGAKFEQHWSYAPIRKPQLPSLSARQTVKHPIDAFVQRRLEREGISPSPRAGKAALLRRLSLDLIGLPPTPSEVEDFLADESADAYEKQVDRLLGSEHYGERMAARWLDIVRFSDTVGFHGDQNQRIFPYRDFVIESLNTNQPFDEFTRDQLAGDLLPSPTEQQLIATGLIRLNMMTREGGAQPGEYLAKYTADRVRMIGTAWLGATTGCCECHNHKYDPFTIQDFYSLGAFFDDVRQWGVYNNYGYTPNPDLSGFSNDHPFPPEIRIASASLRSQMEFLEKQSEQAASQQVDPSELATPEFQAWLRGIQQYHQVHGDQWTVLQPANIETRLPENFEVTPTSEIIFPDSPQTGQQSQITLKTNHPVIIRSLKLEVLPTDIHDGKIGRSANGHFSAALSLTHQPDVERPPNDSEKMTPIKPRYVRIELPNRGILSLAEVQVHAVAQTGTEPKNIAAQGTPSQSSVASAGAPQRAIDGNTSGTYAENSTTHTKTENQPWWELDLGTPTLIQNITIWNRTDSASNRLNGFRLVLLDENRQPVYRTHPSLPAPQVQVDIPAHVSRLDLLNPQKVHQVQADRFRTNRYSNGQPSAFIQGRWESGPSRWQLPENETELPHTAVYHLNEAILLNPQDRLKIELQSEDVGGIRFAVSPTSRMIVNAPVFSESLNKSLKEFSASQTPKDSLNGIPESQQNALKAAWYLHRTAHDKLAAEVARHRQAVAECRSGLALTMVSQPVPAEKLRASRVLPRGNWQNESGQSVQPNTPHFLAGYQAEPKNRLSRLDLANWLTSPENPLTARHYVNRVWKHFFGQGLSNVLDDLGNQGEWPSHPELLDWLASEFASDWDRKRITRLIVTSQTYQQQASVRSELKETDPYNRLLAQQSARRLEAEIIRDNALAISGLLQTQWVGGPSIFPYQPEGYYANLQFPNRRYQPNNDGRQYRRGVYMHWQRTFLHPMLANFDAPSRDECAADRITSNSPQQALTLLNDPVFVEAARAFAVRLLQQLPHSDLNERLNLAFQMALSREPSSAECRALGDFYKTQLDYFSTNPAAAVTAMKGVPPSLIADSPAPLAAFTQVCRVILNLHETITRY